MREQDDPKNEGHTREWQDRARVVSDAKKAASTEASPNQSPISSESGDEADEKSKKKENPENEKDDRFY